MNVNFRNFAIWLVILFMLMGLFRVFQSSTRSISVSDKGSPTSWPTSMRGA